MDPITIKERLEYLRGQKQAECISYDEVAELQGLARYIDRDDVELLELAGVPEFGLFRDKEALQKSFTIQQMLDAFESLEPNKVDNSEYWRGGCELIGRLLLDFGGYGEGSGENAELVAEYFRTTH